MTADSTRTRPKVPPATIGWREWAALPDLGVERIKAKIDTGAKTSALHAFRVQLVERQGVTWAEFAVHPIQRKARPELLCAAKVKGVRRIKSSNGSVEERSIIRTRLTIGTRTFEIDLSLANRDAMGFRLLLGRDALKGFIIEPRRSYRLGKIRKRAE